MNEKIAPTPARATTAGSRSVWRWLAPILVLLAGTLVYANSLGCGFTFDDEWLILDNYRLTEPSERVAYIKYMLFEKTLWRPLKRISLMADYAVWGRERPAGFHATNVAFHVAACLALYALVRRLANSRRVATVAALLFAVHPVHVEAVANISHRKEPMAALFYLLGFLAYLTARHGRPPWLSASGVAARLGLASATTTAWATRLEFGLYALTCYLAGMLSKEVGAVMLPATVLVYELVLVRASRTENLRKLGLLGAAFIPVLALFTWKGYLGSIPRRFGAEQIEWITANATSSYGDVVLIAFKAFGEYLSMLLWPWPLYLDRVFAVPHALSDPGVPVGVLAVLGYVVLLAITLRRSALGFFALSWYGLNLLPVVNIIPLTHWLLAERFLYVPSIGFAIVAAVGLEALWKGAVRALNGAAQARVADVALAVLLLAHAGLTVRQNRVWKDSYNLWGNTLLYNQHSYRALYGYGLELNHQGKRTEAVDYYQRAIVASPSYPEPHYALSLLLLNEGRFDEAIPEATIHARLARKDPEPYMVIGNAYFGLKQYREAAEAYQDAVERNPKHADATFNQANALYAASMFPEALEAIDQALTLKNGNDLHLLRGRILQQLARYDEAEAEFQAVLAVAPSTEAYNALAVVHVRQKRLDDALRVAQQSLALDPEQPNVEQFIERIEARIRP